MVSSLVNTQKFVHTDELLFMEGLYNLQTAAIFFLNSILVQSSGLAAHEKVPFFKFSTCGFCALYGIIWWSFCLAERNHLCNFGRGHNVEPSCEILLNLAQWFRRCYLKKTFTRRTKTDHNSSFQDFGSGLANNASCFYAYAVFYPTAGKPRTHDLKTGINWFSVNSILFKYKYIKMYKHFIYTIRYIWKGYRNKSQPCFDWFKRIYF